MRTLCPLPLVVALVGCSGASSVRVGTPAPPRPENCELELIQANGGQGSPPGLDLVGYVRVDEEQGRSPSDPEVLKRLKPEACQLGGEKVSAGTSGDFFNGYRSGSTHVYMVWRAKSTAPAAPVKF